MLLRYKVKFSDNYVDEVTIPHCIIDQKAYIESKFGGTVVSLEYLGIVK